jgi:REP-associated tyrosine transposase
MARPLRLQWPGGWYHVTSRGNERRNIYADDEDRGQFLQRVARMVELFRLLLHAFVLMENHYHLLLETTECNLSRAMEWLNGRYSQYFNRRHLRCGHLFQGRFKAILVEPETWGLELSRYIHLNPIRIRRHGLSKEQRRHPSVLGRGLELDVWRERIAVLRSFRWSSYRAYIGMDPAPDWLVVNKILSGMGNGTLEERQASYREFVEKAAREGLPQTPWEKLQSAVVLGSDAFVHQIQGSGQEADRREQPSGTILDKRPSFWKVVEAVESMKGESWSQFAGRYNDWGRMMVLALARQHCGLKLRVLGELAGGIDYATVGMAIRRFQDRVEEDAAPKRILHAVNTRLVDF